MKYAAQKGTRDILPQDMYRWHKAEQTFAEVCHSYGYEEIRIPTFEQTDLFLRGVGDTTDVVQKEMYTFDDKGGRSITLRPEGTAGVVRSFIENGMTSLPSPVRMFYNLTAFRYENVQKGRYREFHQFRSDSLSGSMNFMRLSLSQLSFSMPSLLAYRRPSLIDTNISPSANSKEER